MTDYTEKNLGFGLSKEEKAELTALIRQGQESAGFEMEMSTRDEEAERLREQNSRFAEIVLELDERLNLLFEILRLTHRKTEIMNHQIDELMFARGNRDGGGN